MPRLRTCFVSFSRASATRFLTPPNGFPRGSAPTAQTRAATRDCTVEPVFGQRAPEPAGRNACISQLLAPRGAPAHVPTIATARQPRRPRPAGARPLRHARRLPHVCSAPATDLRGCARMQAHRAASPVRATANMVVRMVVHVFAEGAVTWRLTSASPDGTGGGKGAERGRKSRYPMGQADRSEFRDPTGPDFSDFPKPTLATSPRSSRAQSSARRPPNRPSPRLPAPSGSRTRPPPRRPPPRPPSRTASCPCSPPRRSHRPSRGSSRHGPRSSRHAAPCTTRARPRWRSSAKTPSTAALALPPGPDGAHAAAAGAARRETPASRCRPNTPPAPRSGRASSSCARRARRTRRASPHAARTRGSCSASSRCEGRPQHLPRRPPPPRAQKISPRAPQIGSRRRRCKTSPARRLPPRAAAPRARSSPRLAARARPFTRAPAPRRAANSPRRPDAWRASPHPARATRSRAPRRPSTPPRGQPAPARRRG